MKRAPIRAAKNAPGSKRLAPRARELPTRTGAREAGRVLGRAASSQTRHGGGPAGRPLGPTGELGKVGLALFLEGVPTLLGLFAGVEEEVGVVGKLLDPC